MANPTLDHYGHTPEMNALMTETPVFVDTLAAAAKWGRPDAASHFIELRELTDGHYVETFLQNYSAA
jgi:hypothetical protein